MYHIRADFDGINKTKSINLEKFKTNLTKKEYKHYVKIRDMIYFIGNRVRDEFITRLN